MLIFVSLANGGRRVGSEWWVNNVSPPSADADA